MAGRANQIGRTRKDLLQAAARLLKQGRKPSLDEVAQEAAVSRATAYRYFPNVEQLIIEAAVDVAVPEAGDLFANGTPADPVARMERVDDALHRMIAENDVPLRLMLAQSIEQRARGVVDGTVPVRQNRRTPLIEAALAPARADFDPRQLERLKAALALIIGPESMIAFRDVLQLNDQEAQQVRRWAIKSLVNAARKKPAKA